MLLSVKLLGSSCSAVSVEADLDESVESLKFKLEKELNLEPNCQQKLLYMGKTLHGRQSNSYDFYVGKHRHSRVV
jgi:hypothetical protein